MEHIESELAAYMPPVGKPFDLPQLTLATMRYVESNASGVHGSGKLAIFKDSIGSVLEYAHMHGLVDDGNYNVLKTVINTGFGMVVNLVETFIAISKNPEWIQLEKEVQACCLKLCKKK